MITQTESGEGKLYFQSLEIIGEQGDAIDQQFVFPRQCLVLGDSEVGKTSLVKSLTGKPFDPKQQKTQGIDQCLVDNKWKNCNLKDLIFGDLWKFLEFGIVQVLLSTTGRATCNVAQEFIVKFGWKMLVFGFLTVFSVMGFAIVYNLPLTSFSIFFIYFGPVLFQQCAIDCNITSNLRFILVTFISILSHRGLLIGSQLLLVICYFDESFVEFVGCAFPTLGSTAAIALVVLFILIGPIQMPLFDTSQLVKRQNFIVILCFYRLLLSIFIGFIIGFVATVSLVGAFNKESSTKTLLTSTNNRHVVLASIITPFVLISPTDFISEPINRISIRSSMEDGSLGPCNILLILAFFYHCKLALTSPIYYFVITYPLFIYFTFCKECLRTYSIGSFSEYLSNNYTKLAVMGIGEMDRGMLKSALQEKFPSLKLQILDFAGDKEYYAYHHMFLKSHALYVIVFNIAKLVKDSFKNLNTDIERLQFWLESVCSHVPPKTPIFLVGTHRGDLDETCMQTLNGHIRKNLWDPYCDELVVNEVDKLIFFPVENSKGENDVGVQSLRIKIMSVAEEREAARECDIPLTWITLQDAIISLREKKKAKLCVNLKELPYVFDNFICTNWSEETLKYFHEKGLVIYLDKDRDLSNWVLLKPEILVDIIIQLVTPPPQMIQERGFRRDWKLLHRKGMLTESLLTRIISTVQENEEALTAFLEEYDLICPLSNKKVNICSLSDDEEHQPTHFVPSLLPMSADGYIPAWDVNTTDKKFYVFFTRFLPEPLFHRLLSRAHKSSKLKFPNGPVVMFKDVGKFWMSPRQPYRLKLMKEEAIIEVTFSSSNMQGMKPADVLHQVFSMVDEICERDFCFVKFYCGPACPSQECPGYHDNYMHTPHQHTRRHVYNVMPGRQGDNNAPLYCVNNSFEEELQEWIP
ncbi:uncharacterized protein LOC110050719 isoform X2 [Orbicella faveolata]|uniref:uncharacterized protein LOC110050719 isoform X2 n=1 Tax=Orbicella faveolata TaxID=48498 RepID=UPI0009E1BCFD|nr:uncharacterized protein LOC110050719 isoform X2 [Orbicella faveolata]XP_020612367.1 uncharacterized protein LOC110050719 isoform X2 [Orbicella faveolata]XP_020612377.1 uncharacterized protein LOC110050719 isoform X2 [Orbicella faveolata]